MRIRAPFSSPRGCQAAAPSTVRAPVVVLLLVTLLTTLSASAPLAQASIQDEADAFLALYNSLYQRLFTVEEGAWWLAQTDVNDKNDGQRIAAGKAMAAFSGDPEVMQQLRRFRDRKDELSALTKRQLEVAWLLAAEAPGSIPELVSARIEAESRQSSTLDGFQYCLQRSSDGECTEPATPNEIDETLRDSRDPKERLAVWEASKEIGPALAPGLIELQRLRNALAQEMGFDSFFDLQVADYGMTVEEMMAMLQGWVDDIWPLYIELHTWAKYALADRFAQPVPEMIPAHWLPNRWGQSWPGLVDAVDMDALFEHKPPEWLVEQAEAFYVSMGLPELPDTFWERSDLYPVPEGDGRKKNTHASAWHIDLEDDVRSLMSVTNNAQWFSTTHHELGHIYYYMAYTRPDVPVLLRGGANRGFHEGIGDQISIASTQVPYLQQVGLLPEGYAPDEVLWLLNEALTETIAFLPWAAGTISHFEHDLYQDALDPEQWNQRWWEYKERFQGIAPPEQSRLELGLRYCDPATKTHVNDDPAQYYDYAFATVFKYQLHAHIAREILHQPVNACNYFGSKETGEFLESVLSKGNTQDWRELLVEATGEELSTKPMMDYFAPLYAWLQEQNEGRQKGW